MTDYEKSILGFDIEEGRAHSWNGQTEYGKPLADLARTGCDNGADQMLLYDHSEDNEDHEAVIGPTKETARTVDEPILAGGHVRRLENVKKCLYAGASTVLLDVNREDGVDMMKEAADRFGSKKICAYLPDITHTPQAGEYTQLGASMMILKTSTQVPSLQELGEIGESGYEALISCGSHQSVQDMAGGFEIHFGCPLVKRAIFTLEEESMDTYMEMKQMFKGAGIEADTFGSTVAWKDFKPNSDGLIPVIVRDHKSSEVLMMAYMNEESYEATPATGKMTYFSKSRQKLRLRGETSGHFRYMKSPKLGYDNDTILAMVEQIGDTCRTRSGTCFFTTLAEGEYKEANPLKVFEGVYGVIPDRKEHLKEGSYTNHLFDKGIDKILEKLGEEATEVVIAAKSPDSKETKYEISGFLYHTMVLVAGGGVSWKKVTEELANRQNKKQNGSIHLLVSAHLEFSFRVSTSYK